MLTIVNKTLAENNSLRFQSKKLMGRKGDRDRQNTELY